MMTPKQRKDWMESLRVHDLELALLKCVKLLDRLDAQDPSGRWQIGLKAGGGFEKIAARWHGAGTAWLSSLRKLDPKAAAPAAGQPRAELLLDLRLDRCVRTRFFSARDVVSGPFSLSQFPDGPLGPLFASLHDLHPVRALTAARDGGGARWSLRFAEPIPWARFLRLDAAKPFAKGAGPASELVGARGVGELLLDGPELWAFFGA